jgi:hypothetical protein
MPSGQFDQPNVNSWLTQSIEIELIKPKSGSWRPAAVWQIADIMRYGQETRGFAAATGG